MKKSLLYLLLALVIVFIVILSLRLLTPEDDWVCKSGGWVRHGNPSVLAPTTECR